MKVRRTTLFLLAWVLLEVAIWGQEVEIANGHQVAPHEVLVRFRSGVRRETRELGLRRWDMFTARELDNRGLVHVRSETESTSQLLARFETDPDVEYAEPNYIITAAEQDQTATTTATSVNPNDALFSQQWALRNTSQNGNVPHADIDATEAWSIATGTPSVVVGLVDTGLDYNHQDLAANVWSAPTVFTVRFGGGDSIACPAGSHGYDAINNVCDPMDQNGHGTHVAGIIGAVSDNDMGVSGVNWTTSIMGLRFMDANGVGTVANAIRAIQFAVQAKAVLGNASNIRVLSNSWGGASFSKSLQDIIEQAEAAEMLFVVSAGNNAVNLDSSTNYPASFRTPNVITVAATDSSDAIASFSNYGRNSVDLGAPGVGILSTVPGNSYILASGTSMAAPHVSGAAALLLSACTLSTVELRSALLYNVDPIMGLASRTVSGGRLNVYKALRSCAPAMPTLALSTADAVLKATAGGASVKSTIAATPSSGLGGSMALSVAGLPAGVSAQLIPATIAPGGTASLVLTAAPSATLGAFQLSITGSIGTRSSKLTVALMVTPAPSSGRSEKSPSIVKRSGDATVTF